MGFFDWFIKGGITKKGSQLRTFLLFLLDLNQGPSD